MNILKTYSAKKIFTKLCNNSLEIMACKLIYLSIILQKTSGKQYEIKNKNHF